MEDASPDASRQVPRGEIPGARDSAVLALDAVLTLMQLAKAESCQWLAAVPEWLLISLYRLPVLLLTWVSFCAFAACVVFSFTRDMAFAAGSFFLLQLGLTLFLQNRYQRLSERMQFHESRRGLAILQAALKERFEDEGRRA